MQLSLVNFSKNSYLIVEGKPNSDRFYIIRTGTVTCVGSRPGGTPVHLGPGDFVGVVACMSGHAQYENVIAETDVVAIAVRKDQYPDLIQSNVPVALKTIRSFALKMRAMNEQLTQLALKNISIESPEQMFFVASYYDKVGCFDPAVFAYYQYIKACPEGLNVEVAKKRFVALKPRSKAVFFEPTADNIRTYPKGTMIFSECQNGQDMFIIQEGQVKITKIVNNSEVILAVLKKGDFFGEMALLVDSPRSASIIAFEDCQLMVVNRKNFEQMVTSQPQFVSRLTVTLSERLWSMERQLDNAYIQNPAHKMVDMLALQLEKERLDQSTLTAPGKIVHTFDLTPTDVSNMCGISQTEQRMAVEHFLKQGCIGLDESGKVFVSDCKELVNAAAFYRKQLS